MRVHIVSIIKSNLSPPIRIDAYGAQQLVKILQTLAQQGTTIMCTIHQPSSQVFAMFHQVLFLADGRTAFMGTPNAAVDFFAEYVRVHFPFRIHKSLTNIYFG